MQTVLFNSPSKAHMKQLVDFAKTLGIKAKLVTDDEKEDVALLKLMDEARTGEYVDTNSFVASLRNR